MWPQLTISQQRPRRKTELKYNVYANKQTKTLNAENQILLHCNQSIHCHQFTQRHNQTCTAGARESIFFVILYTTEASCFNATAQVPLPVWQQGVTSECMAAFQRPGDRAASAFGIAFLSDRTPEDSESASAAARQQRLQQQTPAQRQLIANGGGGVGPHQQAVLHAVEHHATTVLASDDAAGKRLHLKFVKSAGAIGALQVVSPLCLLQRMPAGTADLMKASRQSSALTNHTDECDVQVSLR